MKILEKKITNEQLNIAKELSKSLNILPLTAKILVERGIDTVEKAENFFNPEKAELTSPFLLNGIKDAVERITFARDNGETVVVYGDYDADGICASTILSNALRTFGLNVYSVIPERENGYGLSQKIIDEVIGNYFPDLIITVDCGISGKEQVEYIKDLGVDIIVTDHHEIPEEVPDCITVNCKFPNQDFGFDCLSGAGVAYELSYALIGEKANSLLDLVAIATVADSMPLIGENRSLVARGLSIMRSNKCRPQIKALLDISGAKDITATTLAFMLAPRINAAGRMGDAYSALKLLNSESFSEINELSKKLSNYNIARQEKCDELLRTCKEQLNVKGNYGKVIVLYGENWQNGLLGIVAAKITEEYNMPTVLLSKSGEYYHGSARSIEGVNIFEALTSVKDLTVDYGGHSQAAGVTIYHENIEEFAIGLNDYIEKNVPTELLEKQFEVDAYITEKFSMRLVKELSLFEPCGIENRKPVFAINTQKMNSYPIKDGSKHIAIPCENIDFMYFNGLEYLPIINSNEDKTLVFEINLSSFNGRESFKGFVKFIEVQNEFSKIYELIRKIKTGTATKSDFETFEFSVKREDFISVYKHIISASKQGAVSVLDAYLNYGGNGFGITYLFAGETFKELGFFTESTILKVNQGVKNDLTNSKIYNYLSEIKNGK